MMKTMTAFFKPVWFVGRAMMKQIV